MKNTKQLFFLFVGITYLFSLSVYGKPYKGAEIYSNESYLYGRFEMRMQMAKGSGILSTFFTYKNGSEIDGNFWEEIDIEVFGKDSAFNWQSNIILGNSTPTIMSVEDHSNVTSLAENYHTYVLEWTPDYVAWFLDGEEVRRITGSSTVTSLMSAHSLRFNIWSSESAIWAGAWDDSILPRYQFVDYLRYQPYNTETQQFEDGWRDDFNVFDTTRWGKANWTFNENRVDFAPENVVIKDGILILAITKNNALGYDGTPPQPTASSSSAISASSSSSLTFSSSSLAVSSSTSSLPSSESSSAPPSSSVASSISPPKKNGGGGGGSTGLGVIFFLTFLLALQSRKTKYY